MTVWVGRRWCLKIFHSQASAEVLQSFLESVKSGGAVARSLAADGYSQCPHRDPWWGFWSTRSDNLSLETLMAWNMAFFQPSALRLSSTCTNRGHPRRHPLCPWCSGRERAGLCSQSIDQVYQQYPGRTSISSRCLKLRRLAWMDCCLEPLCQRWGSDFSRNVAVVVDFTKNIIYKDSVLVTSATCACN